MTAGPMWEYGHDQGDWADNRLIHYNVEATDGDIGRVDEASARAGTQSLVIDAGEWLTHRKVMVPAGLIQRIDHDGERIYLSCTKEQVKDSPEFTDDSRDDQSFTDKLGDYWQKLFSRS
jgi:hypothetical protein